MLAELVAEDGGVEPVERELAAADHFHQRVEHLRLVAQLVAEAEPLLALDQVQRPDLAGLDRGGAVLGALGGLAALWPGAALSALSALSARRIRCLWRIRHSSTPVGSGRPAVTTPDSPAARASGPRFS